MSRLILLVFYFLLCVTKSRTNCIASRVCTYPNVTINDYGMYTSSIALSTSHIPEYSPKLTSLTISVRATHTFQGDIKLTLQLNDSLLNPSIILTENILL